MTTISVIGAGRIGSAVIAHIKATPGLRLGRVLTRGGAPDTDDPAAFLAAPSDIILDTAGPQALRQYGVACLARAPVWSVGGSALVDADLRRQVQATAERTGNPLRLFSPWSFGIGTVPRSLMTRLTITVTRPGLEKAWRGSLEDAARRHPNEVNFAMAAALAGPGIAATEIAIEPATDGAHRIDSVLATRAGLYRSSVTLDHGAGHPTALALVAALDRRADAIRCG